MIPDEFLARNVAAQTRVEIIPWRGRCEVHERFTAADIRELREAHPGAAVLAHPECSPEVVAEADFTGSTAEMMRYVGTKRIISAVEPVKSASATTSGEHSGWASTAAPGWASRSSRMSAAVNRSWTSQRPRQGMISTRVCAATFLARNSSGIMMTRGAPSDSTTFTALADVQQMSEAAFTSAEVLT